MTRLISEVVATLRQFQYPKPLRIDRFDAKSTIDVESALTTLSDVASHFTLPEDPIPNSDPFEQDQFLADFATRLWRVKANLLDPDTLEPIPVVSRGYRQLQKAFDVLGSIDVEIVDKTGDFYDPGHIMDVVAAEPVPGARREIIKETIRPAVYRGGRSIQTAEVIVGTVVPEPDEDSSQ